MQKEDEFRATLDIVEEWGFKNEAAKKALEFKIKRDRDRKKKTKILSAEERFKKFQKKAGGNP